jgi:hypothetical protein
MMLATSSQKDFPLSISMRVACRLSLDESVVLSPCDLPPIWLYITTILCSSCFTILWIVEFKLFLDSCLQSYGNVQIFSEVSGDITYWINPALVLTQTRPRLPFSLIWRNPRVNPTNDSDLTRFLIQLSLSDGTRLLTPTNSNLNLTRPWPRWYFFSYPGLTWHYFSLSHTLPIQSYPILATSDFNTNLSLTQS